MKISPADKIFIAGHKGMVGSAIMRRLAEEGFSNFLTADRTQLDLLQQNAVAEFIAANKPDIVILAAAKVGGIQANIDAPADFLYQNLQIQCNIIHQSYLHKVKKLVVLGSSCVYPRECPQPMKEEYLLTGKLEPTNEGYALAKIAGLKMAKYYHDQYGLNTLSPMPCNLYGQNDSFDPRTSHVLSALVKKFVDAKADNRKEIILWGTGKARREMMHVDDAARAVYFLLQNYDDPDLINVGWGVDYSIAELADIVARKAGFTGSIQWDTTKPDGMPRKCLDITRIKNLGFTPQITIEEGVSQLINEYSRLSSS